MSEIEKTENQTGGTFGDAFKNIEAGDPNRQDFRKLVGLEIVESRLGYAKGEIVLQPYHMNILGIVHGGVFFTMADTVSGAAAATGREYAVPTITGTINYMRAGKNTSKLIAEAEEVKNGKSFSVCDCKIYDDKGSLLAKTTMTFYHLWPKE